MNDGRRKKGKKSPQNEQLGSKTITVRHEIAVIQPQGQAQSSASRDNKEIENLKLRMLLLNDGFLESDEESGFSVTAEKKSISRRMYTILSDRY